MKTKIGKSTGNSYVRDGARLITYGKPASAKENAPQLSDVTYPTVAKAKSAMGKAP